MRGIATMFGCMLMAGLLGGLLAQTAAPELSSSDANKAAAHDRPVGGIRMKLPAPAGGAGQSGTQTPPPAFAATPPSEGEDVPPSESAPPEAEDGQTFMGESVNGNYGFLIDLSGSMAGTKIATVRAETSALVTSMNEEQSLDITVFGFQFPASQGYTKFMWGALLPATGGNKTAALGWISGPSMNPGGGSPLYQALNKCCQVYPAELTMFFLMTDGHNHSRPETLRDLPTWWKKFPEATFVSCAVQPYNASVAQFLQALAQCVGGTYIAM